MLTVEGMSSEMTTQSGLLGMPSLKRSFFWSAVEQLAPQFCQFIVAVALARLLEPGAFGLMGMLVLFTSLAQAFADCGLSASLIQRKTITRDDETSVFALNVGAGLVLAALLCALSPLVAWFYGQPVLLPMLCVLSVSLVISSFCLVQPALLARTMQFHKTAAISTVSMVVAGVTGIVMAYVGCGVWSLVGSGLSGNLARAGLYWGVTAWRPRGRPQIRCIRAMWSFSVNLLYCRLMGIAYQNLYAVVIGKAYSPASLGYYDRANSWRMLPVGTMTGIVNRVAFPWFSRCQDDKVLLLRRVRELVRVTLLLSAAGLTLLTVWADPLIPLLLTEKWRPAIPLLRILCYAGVLYPVHTLYLMTLQAQGYSHLNARLETIKVITGFIAVALVWRHGVTALAWSAVGLTLIAYFLNAWYNVRLLGYRWRSQAFDILPTFVLCASAGWAAWWSGTLVSERLLATLLVRLAMFVALVGCGVFLFRGIFFVDAWKHLAWAVTRLRAGAGRLTLMLPLLGTSG